MKNSCLVVLLIILSSCKKEEAITRDFSNIEYTLTSKYNKEKAEEDVKTKNMVILFSGGFGGMPNFYNKTDSIFQKNIMLSFMQKDVLDLVYLKMK